jgi:PhnB protein
MRLNPYLAFNGQCEAAFKFYEECLGGKIVFMMTYGDSPQAGQTPPDLHKRIFHATLTVGDQVLSGADAPPEHYQKPQGFCVQLNIGAMEQAERIFTALAEKAVVQMPLQETFWALRFGMLIDQFGIPWIINCEKPA